MERPRTLILFDTNELLRAQPRKLHSAWAEIKGRKITVTPTVAKELAPDGYPLDFFGSRSVAEERLTRSTKQLHPKALKQLQRDAWWSKMWRADGTPYNVRTLTVDEQKLADEIERTIHYDCFKEGKPGYIRGHQDTRIIAEALATGGTILLTSNIRSIKHKEVNGWAIKSGEHFGFKPRPVVQDTDAMMLRTTRRPQQTDLWLQAGIIACWPRNDKTTSEKIVQDTIAELEHMLEGRLPGAGKRLTESLATHRNPNRLVDAVRKRLPSTTISTDREHPAYRRAICDSAIEPTTTPVIRGKGRPVGGAPTTDEHSTRPIQKPER